MERECRGGAWVVHSISRICFAFVHFGMATTFLGLGSAPFGEARNSSSLP